MASRPIRGYPAELRHLGDHVLKRRLDLGRNRKETAAELGIDAVSLKNWEEGRTKIEVRFFPRIIRWLGYDPLPTPSSDGQQVEHARIRRGWSRKRLALEAGVDEATIARIEADIPRLAQHSIRAVCRYLGIDVGNPRSS